MERISPPDSLLRRTIGPALLMIVTPPLVVVVWMINAHFDGSVARFAREIDADTFVALVPRPTLAALRMLVVWVAFQAALLVALPAETYLGPVTPSGLRPAYRDNGVLCWIVSHLAVVAGARLGLFTFTSVWREFGALLVTLNLAALVFCGWLYLRGTRGAPPGDAVVTGHPLFDFFQGIELHPTLFGVSLKQLVNCRVSMMGWSVLLVCFAGRQIEATGRLSTAMAVSTGLLVAYLFKFFVWETGYFTSLDIMHDRFGYYICWGVLVWVPGVYTVSGQYLCAHPVPLSPLAAAAIAAFGLAALWMNYAADAQRQRVRASDGHALVWGRSPRILRARYRTLDGEERESILLTSGYWGLARHFHYLPEVGCALSWALPAAGSAFLPYFYAFFLAILLVDRAGRDDRRCQAKYGAAWDEYRGLVPWKIIPRIY